MKNQVLKLALVTTLATTTIVGGTIRLEAAIGISSNVMDGAGKPLSTEKIDAIRQYLNYLEKFKNQAIYTREYVNETGSIKGNAIIGFMTSNIGTEIFETAPETSPRVSENYICYFEGGSIKIASGCEYYIGENINVENPELAKVVQMDADTAGQKTREIQNTLEWVASLGDNVIDKSSEADKTDHVSDARYLMTFERIGSNDVISMQIKELFLRNNIESEMEMKLNWLQDLYSGNKGTVIIMNVDAMQDKEYCLDDANAGSVNAV